AAPQTGDPARLPSKLPRPGLKMIYRDHPRHCPADGTALILLAEVKLARRNRRERRRINELKSRVFARQIFASTRRLHWYRIGRSLISHTQKAALPNKRCAAARLDVPPLR